MAVLETWDSKSGCACNECQTWSRAAGAIPLERKEPWQTASPFAQQLSAAALDAHLAPLVARVAALEAVNARLVELTENLRRLALMEAETKQAINRAAAYVAAMRDKQIAEAGP